MTIAQAGNRSAAGVTTAEVNLKLIWDLVSQIKVGNTGLAYVVDKRGQLIAHPDISLVLRNTDLSVLPQVQAALGTASDETPSHDLAGRRVLSTVATVPELGWFVFIELSLREALVPLFAALVRTGGLLLLGLAIALMAGLALARRMVVPIKALEVGAERIGAGDLDRRIDVSTGDELEALAWSFNDMAGRLKESRAELETRVSERTRELARSVEELTALGDVSQALNSTLDLSTVLTTIVAKAVQLSGADAGGIHEFDEARQVFQLTAIYGSNPELNAQINALAIGPGETPIGQATARRAPVQVPDLAEMAPSKSRDLLERGGFHALLVVPLLRGDRVLGGLVVRRKKAGRFDDSTVALLETFAANSVIALENARLFAELAEKSKQLEIASHHKSQFLANMSHELRTPLNAILGYTELIIDGIYDQVPSRTHNVLERVQFNGQHLLSLINDVLDISKIEAGEVALTVVDYDVSTIVQTVVAATESLASSKGLEIRTRIADQMPKGRGDERRLTQVFVNLVGNAIKFTDAGLVEIVATAADDRFELSVRDTGPGIPEDDRELIFKEFHQGDPSSTRTKGGSGLGLAIARRFVELHGGTIGLVSRSGEGSVFVVSLPIIVEAMGQAA